MRQRREESTTCVYHVMVKGIEGENIFEVNRDKSRMLKIIADQMLDFQIRIYAYTVLDNHIHLLIKSNIQELSSYMAKILAAYAKYYNYKKDKKGKVFQSRFFSEAIETETKFWNCMRYIHAHAVYSKDIKNMARYTYSSIGEYYKEGYHILDYSLKTYIQSQFVTIKEFMQYNQKEVETLVWDIKADLDMQRMVLMKRVILKIAKEEQVEYEEILEYYPYVEKSINQGRKELKTTYNEARIIVNKLKKRS